MIVERRTTYYKLIRLTIGDRTDFFRIYGSVYCSTKTSPILEESLVNELNLMDCPISKFNEHAKRLCTERVIKPKPLGRKDRKNNNYEH